MLDKELLNIIKEKRFGNVWVLLQYLIDIGLDEDVCLEVISNFFTEGDYFKDVAYARKVMAIETNITNPLLGQSLIEDTKWILYIGLLDKSEYKLKRVFDIYKRGLNEKNITPHIARRIEGLCKSENMYEFKNLTTKTIDYLKNIAIKHYGYNLI
tara:strand:+ start:3453 stop:3917 length:465 start_codon:yes stop_codon:yes gene_type:complete